MTTPASFPRVVAAPGQTFELVVSRSSAGLGRPDGLRGLQASQALCRHVFEFALPAWAFVTEPGSFTLLELEDGVVEALRVTPLLSYVDELAVADSSALLCRRLEEAGWRRHGSYAVRRAIVQAKQAREGIVCNWMAGPWAAQARIRRVHEAASSLGKLLKLSHDLYLLTLWIGQRSKLIR